MVDIAQALDAHQNNKHAEAERLYHELLAADPNNPNILHLMAISYGQRGLLSKAEEYVLKAIQLNPDSSSFYNSYANIKKYQHDITAAIDLYKKSIIINSINPAAYYNLGIIYLQRQEYKISEEFLYLAIKQKEDYEEAYIMLIQCLHESAQYKKASELLNKAKKLDFQSSKFILFYAQNLQFQNNLTKAKSMLLKYVDISPDDYQGHHHLATTYLADGDIKNATKHNLKALELNDSHHETHHNIAVIYLTQSKLDLALKHWLQALRFEHNIDYIYNIGVVYNYKGLYSDALSYFEKCLTIEDEHYNSIANIAVIYLKKNMPSEAKFYFRKALNIKPDDEQNIYMLAALEGNQEKFKAAPPSYITDLFDQYANTFEQHLEKILQYKAPKIIYETLVKFNDIENCKNLDICDVGCGTGLMAEELKQHSKKLIGVDLSSKMLEKASVKKLYTDLVESDISVYLSQHKLEFDYIIAADVVPYFGDISVLLQSAFGALKNEGYFVFSIEQCFKTNYQLQTNGRFKHSREYIKSLSNENMFNLKACTERSTRKEGNNEIPCLIFVLQKQIASSIT